MSGRDNIMGPEAVQLPASVFSLPSRKSFSNFVPVLTDDENFFHGHLFLISVSFNYCLSTTPFIQLSATLSAKSFKMQRHAGKTMSANKELITATSFFSAIQSIFFWVSLYLEYASGCIPARVCSTSRCFFRGPVTEEAYWLLQANLPILIHPLPSHLTHLLSLPPSGV